MIADFLWCLGWEEFFFSFVSAVNSLVEEKDQSPQSQKSQPHGPDNAGSYYQKHTQRHLKMRTSKFSTRNPNCMPCIKYFLRLLPLPPSLRPRAKCARQRSLVSDLGESQCYGNDPTDAMIHFPVTSPFVPQRIFVLVLYRNASILSSSPWSTIHHRDGERERERKREREKH